MAQDQSLLQKVKFLLGFYLKIVIQWGQWTFGAGSLLGQILASEGASLHHPSRENHV